VVDSYSVRSVSVSALPIFVRSNLEMQSSSLSQQQTSRMQTDCIKVKSKMMTPSNKKSSLSVTRRSADAQSQSDEH
jgi:hypothetical protein